MPYDKLGLKEKIAVVIGGTSGIGRACAHGFAEAEVCAVIASSRRFGEVERAAAELEAKGVETLRRTMDVMDRASLVALRNLVVKKFGRIDILLSEAARTKKVPTLEL